MDKCNLLLQDDGAKSNEINGPREIRSEIDERISCEDPPDGGPSQNGTNHETEAIITVQTISYYDSEEKFTPRDFNIRPGTRPAGEHHSISVSCFARISGQDANMVAAWSRLEQRFLELDFHFPGLRLPLFTIRVLVVEDQEEDISLSGGLGFAQRTLKSARAFDLERTPSSRRRRFLPTIRKHPAEPSGPWHKRPWRTPGLANRPPPFTFRDIEQIACSPSYLAGFIPHQPVPVPFTWSLPSLPDTDDQLSVSTDYTGDSMETPALTLSSTITNWVDDNLEPPETFEISPGDILETGAPFSGIADHWASDHAKGQQYSAESFEQQRRKAEGMYAYNGDTSGMVAIMALASASSSANNADIFYNTTNN